MSDSRITQEDFKAYVVRARPGRIEDLYDDTNYDEAPPPSRILQRGADHNTNLQHYHSENMEWWCSNLEISQFIADTNRVNTLLSALGSATTLLGLNMQQQGLADLSVIFMSTTCQGCNTPYDNGGCSHGEEEFQRAPLRDVTLTRMLHTASITASIVSHLLLDTHRSSQNAAASARSSDADKIVRLILDREPECGMSMNEIWAKLERQRVTGMPTFLSSLLGLVDNCSFAFPKLVHKSMGLMSLIICRYPARALGTLDEDEFVKILSKKYMSSIFHLIHNCACRVEERFGVVAFCNVLPALYHLGPCKLSHRSQDFPMLIAGFASSIINVCHSATHPGAEDLVDVPVDLDEFPELESAKILIEPLLVVDDGDDDDAEWRVKILRERPMSFLVAAGLEILCWWACKGVDLNKAPIPGYPGETLTLRDSVEEYLPRIRKLVSRTPRLAYMERQAEALAKGETSPSELAPLVKHASRTLLHGPLMDANRRCGYCRKPPSSSQDNDTANGGKRDLKRCGGGCSGMEQYCCKEHQRAHWKRHKAFCLANKKEHAFYVMTVYNIKRKELKLVPVKHRWLYRWRP